MRPTMLDRMFNEVHHYQLHQVNEDAWLRWWPSVGIGFLETPTLIPYEDAYWDYYNGIRDNPIGKKLNEARVGISKSVWSCLGGTGAMQCDVGIGNGEFVEAMGCFGTDVNPHALKWLRERKLLTPNVYIHGVLSFWDVLEHIPDPTPLLEAANVIMTSLPIHESVEACLTSKHLKPGEHVWHFTDGGIKHFMTMNGYSCVYSSDIETQAGREGIMSYVFSKLPLNLNGK